ncbi:MAG TPA: ABC transporter ATP-binding protein [Vicinamibacterales bacterium]|jgi:ABC-2 type transport system ATP-binding protein
MESSREPSANGLHIRQLSKRFGRLAALDNVSFTVRRGEVLGIIGPNGAGKTTLLECLAGVLPSDAGEVTLGGRPLDAAGRVGTLFYLPDVITPWPSQTVSWALKFAVGFLGGRSNDVHDVTTDLDLWPILDQRIGTLSKGQRKRAVLAVGLLSPQPILVSDEPFDGLDLRQTRDVGAALRRRAASGRTLVLSIHQIDDAARVCDRFVLLSAGRVCGEGTVRELAERAGSAGRQDLAEVFLALT